MTKTTERKFWDVDELRRHYERHARGYWFSPDNMRMFGTRLSGDTFAEDGSVFITSEVRWGDDSRTYRIRWYDWREVPNIDNDTPRGTIQTVATFATLAQAKKYAATLNLAVLHSIDWATHDSYGMGSI